MKWEDVENRICEMLRMTEFDEVVKIYNRLAERHGIGGIDYLYPEGQDEAVWIHDDINKGDRCKALGLDAFAYDVAMPQPWIDNAADYLYKAQNLPTTGRDQFYSALVYGIIWLYDNHARIFGRPYPTTQTAREMLARLPENMQGGDIPPPEPKE